MAAADDAAAAATAGGGGGGGDGGGGYCEHVQSEGFSGMACSMLRMLSADSDWEHQDFRLRLSDIISLRLDR